MRLRKIIKHNARLALSRHWCKACSIVMITLMFWVFIHTAEQFALNIFNVSGFEDILNTPGISFDDIPNISPAAMVITALSAIFCLLVIEPLKLGAKCWYYQLTDGRELAASEIFRFFFSFGRYFRALFFTILLFFKKLFWGVIFLLVPSAALAGGFVWESRAFSDFESILSTGLKVSGTISFAAMSILLLIWLNRYCLSEYMLASDDSLSANGAIKRSVIITRGRLWEFFMLELSLIGWRILDILIFPRLYTIPYISVIKSLYARYLSELYLREQAVSRAEDTPNTADDEQAVPEQRQTAHPAEDASAPETEDVTPNQNDTSCDINNIPDTPNREQ